MSFDFSFSTLQDAKQLGDLVAFIAKQDLQYPRYQQWVEKAQSELRAGYKQAILAYSEGRLVGDIIFQPHKSVSTLLEIKNLRVHPRLRGRDFPRFMIRQLEFEAEKYYDALISDIRAEQKQIAALSLSWGFTPVATLPLYGDEKPDIVVVKFLRSGRKNLVVPVAQRAAFQQATRS